LTEETTPLLLSPKDYQFVAKTAKELWGWGTITITGGEPLVSPIYGEVCELIRQEGIRITTVTNASLVSSPRKLLKDSSQVNISLHTMNPEVYRKITKISYPLAQVLDTIISIRVQFPDTEIHLNSTIIRGMNDSEDDYEKIIAFATRIGARAKFIDLASSNPKHIVPIEEIQTTLCELGFETIDENTWQIVMQRKEDKVVLTRCGFGENYKDWSQRNLFLNPDGIISADSCGGLVINLVKEIHERDIDGFAKKVEWYFSPAKRI